MDILTSIETVMDSDLLHYGRKGMKWGVRNGPPYPLHPEQLSPAEKKTRRSVFISGSSKTQFEDSGYYRKELPKAIQNKIDDYIKDHAHIIVGDAPGIDRQVQDYLNEKGYDSVEIYGPGKQVRYAANDKWKTNPVDAPEFEEMSPEWLRKKDIAMTNDATEGLAIVLDDGAQATRNNVARLREQGKQAEVFILGKDGEDDWEANPGTYEQMHKYLDRIDFPEAYSYLFDSYGKLTSAGRKAIEHYFEKIPNEHERSGIDYAFENGGITKVKDGYELQENGHIRRVASENEPLDSRRKYASVTRNDAILYDQWYHEGELDTKTDTPSYTYEYSAKPKFKIADEAAVVSYVADAYGSADSKYNAEIYNKYLTGRLSPKEYSTGEDTYRDALFDHALSIVHDVQQEFKRANGIRGRSDAVNKGKTSLYKHFSKLGYDAIVDVEDYMRDTELPIIVLNPKESLTVEKAGRWTDYSLFDAYDEYKKSLSHSDFLSAVELVQIEDLEHHGRKGMKWGVRNGPPYPLDQDRLSPAEREAADNKVKAEKEAAKIATERIKKAWKTHGLVDDIINSMSADDRYKVLAGDDHYLNKEESSHVVKRSITKVQGKAASFIDLLDDGKQLQVAIGTRAGDEYRGKGYGYKAAKNAIKWYEQHKYELPYEEIVWGVLVDNYGSIRIAEKLGFERDESSISDDGTWINYVKKTNKNSLSHSDFLSAVELVLPDDALQYGVLGQKWGIRKWQNKDGTLTPAGRERWINSLKQEAYAASKKWEEYQQVRKQVIDMHYEGKFDNELETKMLRLKEEANEAGAVWGSLRKRIESYLENGPDVSTSEPVEDAPHKVLIPVSDEKKYQHFLELGYEEKGRNDTWIYMVNRKKNIKHSDNQNDVLAAVETVMDGDALHYQRKGAKWGIRNGPPYPLQPDQLSARERMLDSSGKKNIAATGERKKWQSSDTLSELASIPYNGLVGGKLTHLGRKHLDKMLSSKELQDFAERNSKSKAYSLKKAGVLKSEQGGSVIGKDTTMQRIADSSDAITDKRKYVSVTSNDQKHYKSIYDKGFLAVKNRDDAAAFKYKGKKELRVADASDVMNYIVDSYGHRKEKKFYSDVKKIEPYRDAFKELYRTGLGSAADLAVANYYDYASFELKRFVKNNLWDGASESGKQTYAKNKQKEILNHYKELGYDAIADVEDVLSGYEYPIILINPSESIRLSGKQKLSHSDLYLAHYRRGGEKKGVRRWQNYDGSLTPAGREHYGIGPPREAKAEDPERATLSKSGIYKQNAQTDIIVGGTKFVRQASAKDDQYHDRKYMSVTKKDVDYWRGEQEAEYTYEAKRNLKVANAQAVVDYIVQDMMGYGQSEEGKKLSSLYEKYRGNTWDHFFEKRSNKKERAQMWKVVTKQRSAYGREGATESHRQILDHFSQLGYDAMVDINQSWQGMEYPIIVIDPDDSTKLVTKLVRRS